MNRTLLFLLIIISGEFSHAQNFTGQWKGGFIDKSVSALSWGGVRCDYVLDLDVKGQKVTGYSYTYFSDGGKKYYTICRLTGVADLNKKSIEVRETERTKTNVPDNISNSFQVHKLKWRREGENEIIEGNWEPAPGQDRSSTGYGTTSLAKRQLTEISALVKKINSKKFPVHPESNSAIVFTKSKNPITVKKIAPAFVKKPVKVLPNEYASPVKKNPVQKTAVIAKIPAPAENTIPVNFEKRNNAVLQTVVVENATVRLELYDNGDVDGDSISLFYNGDVLLAHKRLTETPITLSIQVKYDEENELIMYADNLGTIAPNTALLIVRDGNRRYEVRITSDLKKSGTIRFVHKKDRE